MSNYSNIDYEKFINDLNSGLIVSAEFSFKNYAHYKNCVIERGVLKNWTGGEVPTIKVRLTKDGSEKTVLIQKDWEIYSINVVGKYMYFIAFEPTVEGSSTTAQYRNNKIYKFRCKF